MGSPVRDFRQPLLVLFAVVSMTLLAAAAHAQPCDPAGADARAIQAVRADISDSCGCGESGRPGAHLNCAQGVIGTSVGAGSLRKECRGYLRRDAKRSVCNATSGVVCCVTDANGLTRGKIKRSAERCRARAGGSACVSSALSVVGACDEGGCVPSCGNGIVELYLGETCDPPNGTACSASCTTISTCGNGIIERPEECDGQPGCSPGCEIATSSCCQLGEYCYDGASDHGGIDDYFFWKGCSFYLGGTSSSGFCHATAPCPSDYPPDYCAVGTCEDVALAPLRLCCQEAGSCRDATVASYAELDGFGCQNWIVNPKIGPLRWQLMGTCGTNGLCVPAS